MHLNVGRNTSRLIVSVFALVAGFTATSAFAQTAKVIKVQGKKAIVQFPDDARPRVGQTIDLGGVSMSSAGDHTSTGERAQIIGGSVELSSLTPSSNISSLTVLSLDGRYGWNTGLMEYGPLGSIYYYSTTGSTRRRLEAGGFFDYNLVPNTPGTEIVYGGMVTGKFGQIATSTGSSDSSGTVMTVQFGGQLKWFPLGNTVAIRGDILYQLESISDTVKIYSVGVGLIAKGGLYVYF